ncbi:hypothetical protein SAMN05660816_06890 [Niastella yeongjuensis]|nr:hypothetical protein SAMN05660816_06890 [Niastella yeongjuensis]
MESKFGLKNRVHVPGSRDLVSESRFLHNYFLKMGSNPQEI